MSGRRLGCSVGLGREIEGKLLGAMLKVVGETNEPDETLRRINNVAVSREDLPVWEMAVNWNISGSNEDSMAASSLTSAARVTNARWKCFLAFTSC